jgi:GxxExxY protein
VRLARSSDARQISKVIIGCAMQVHTDLGPGLLESTYKVCLRHQLEKAGLSVRTEVAVPIVYDGLHLNAGYRLDMLVEDLVIVEAKCAEAIAPIHHAQVLSYLKLSGKSMALLINFHVVHLKDGIKRFVMGTDWK